jgi:hypothetical protein
VGSGATRWALGDQRNCDSPWMCLPCATGIAADAVSHWFRKPASVGLDVPPLSTPGCLSNTADQLRSGAPVQLADGGTGRHLSSPYGCRPELRQLHPLVGPLTSREPNAPDKPYSEAQQDDEPDGVRQPGPTLPHQLRKVLVQWQPAHSR